MNNIIRKLALAFSLGFASHVFAYDVELLSGTNPALDPGRAGTVIAEQASQFSFSGELLRYHQEPRLLNGTIAGSVVSRVVRTADGTLDFYWRVQVAPDALFGVIQFDLGGFTGLPMRANFRADLGGDVAPELWVLDGDVQSFVFRSQWPNAVWPGLQSAYFFLDTDATDYSKDGRFSLTSDDDTQSWWSRGRSQDYATFSPSAVPEPQTWALLLLGLATVAAAGRYAQRR